ncbi:cell division protein FtsA [Prevotella pallens]|jgi:cell division protein ftsA|uniref:Cell division protein FtsA n=2 Tax=Prevotella pallens TaxID=60133 RepID=A0A379F3B0_9BACT|nr:cell division protein FtsA [Prevotella pallens]EGQ21322.1 cell division protein FtsA [Prevotella pallens ATCC 700821]MBF1471276.1 cell division protein FtsA [Prevotella pallens]MBF1475134.1 cell division protein FtsA [Prevotella pallens]MBF1478584.1 cell division protein FtsA [Prevotella pallens]MBF1480959.1 cell division protein FtsA [Prevotella pallens]
MAEFIVAIELGSSKITGIAGKKNLDGSISVNAVVKEDASQCIRKGVVYNIDKTGQCLTNIINKLKKQLKHEITHVYVGVGGQSIRSVKNVIVKELPAGTIISSNMINELMDANRNMSYPDQEILDAATQEYKVDNQDAIDPVGIKANHLEGNFLNILWRKSFYDNLNSCFEKAGIAIAEMYLAPLALADSILTDNEKRGGCVLVDLGAETTTVSVYYKSILRHLVVLPLGGANITKDIASLHIEEKDAEKLKLTYGSAYTNDEDIDDKHSYTISNDSSIESRKLVDIIESRVEEIIKNVIYQIPSEYANKLLGGFILTGGGSNMKNIEQAFRTHSHVDKIRIAKFVTQTINANNADINAKNATMNTILGLLAKGDINCAGAPINSDKKLFDDVTKPTTSTTSDLHKEPRKAPEIGQGVVLTAAEKEKAEAERRRMEEEERKRREEEEEKRKHDEEEKRKNSFWGKFTLKMKEISGKILEAEDE